MELLFYSNDEELHLGHQYISPSMCMFLKPPLTNNPQTYEKISEPWFKARLMSSWKCLEVQLWLLFKLYLAFSSLKRWSNGKFLLSAYSMRWWIHLLYLFMALRLLKWRNTPPTIPGTPATVSKKPVSGDPFVFSHSVWIVSCEAILRIPDEFNVMISHSVF